MYCLLIKTTSHGLEQFQARIYSTDGVLCFTQSAWSLAGIRTWLSEQGVPVSVQPKRIHSV